MGTSLDKHKCSEVVFNRMNVVDNTALAKNISDGVAELLAAGKSLEEELPAVVGQILNEAFPLLGQLNALNATLTSAIAELAHWRVIFVSLVVLLQRLDGASLHLGSPLPPVPDSTKGDL